MTNELGPRLHGCRLTQPATAEAALVWFAAEPDAIGYVYGPRQAQWFAVDADGAVVTSRPGSAATRRLDLADVFELHATDGVRQLRWRHRDGGAGDAVAMSEDEATLPPTLDDGTGIEPLPAGRPRHRLGTTARLLAGRVHPDGAPPGWTTLTSARLGRLRVPYASDEAAADAPATTGDPAGGRWLAARLAEYAVTDEHGNVDVVDTLLLGLEAAAGTAEDGDEGSEQ